MHWGFFEDFKIKNFKNLFPHRPLQEARTSSHSIKEQLTWLLKQTPSSGKNIELQFNSRLVFTDKLPMLLKKITAGIPGQQWQTPSGDIVAKFGKPSENTKPSTLALSLLDQPHQLITNLNENLAYTLEFYILNQKLKKQKQGFFAASDKHFEHVIFNDNAGPIVIEDRVKIEPFSYLMGPLYIGAGTQIKSHTRLSHSSFGPECRLAGEISNSIFDGFSNKAHHGYVGHSYIGQWVNLGAGTSNSNLKNTYGQIQLHNGDEVIPTGQQMMGALLADFVKTGINTSLLCGSLWSVGAQFAKSGLGPKFIKAFGFEIDAGSTTQPFEKFITTAEKMMARRKQTLTPEQRQKLSLVYSQS
jgi:glucose-1-phosphate thymidylyltransferase